MPWPAGWTLEEADYGNIHGWMRDGTHIAAFCRQGSDSWTRAVEMIEGRAPGPIFRRTLERGTTLFDQAALLACFGLECVPIPDPRAALPN